MRIEASHGYYREGYAHDASQVPEPGSYSVSISSFVPDVPQGPFFRNPARRMRSLPNREVFTCCLFWETLADQASYTITRVDLVGHGWPLPVLKLQGLLGSCGTNVHPGFLLLAMSLSEGYDRQRVGQDLSDVGVLVLRALAPVLAARFPPVARDMADAMCRTAMPESLRAFVPNGDRYRLAPDAALADQWRTVVADTIRGHLAAAR